MLRTIIQPAGQPALELPPPPPAKGQGGHAKRLAGVPGRKTGIRVPAGTFRVRYVQRQSGGVREQSWVQIAPGRWPLVRFENPKLVLELVAFGTKGRSEIRGEVLTSHPQLLPPKAAPAVPKAAKAK